MVIANIATPHMDDFMFLDTEAQGENAIFISHKGLICTDASNIIPMPSCTAHFQLLYYLAYPVCFLISLFKTSPAEKLIKKLQFDFHSLITALDTYVTHDKWDYHQQDEAWMKVGKAQRDVPAHWAHEYCRADRAFNPLLSFHEETLPRDLTLIDLFVNDTKSWFPLAISNSGLGFNWAAGRWTDEVCFARAGLLIPAPTNAVKFDLLAVSHLDEVRTADLTQSRTILETASPNHDFRLS